MRLSHLALVTCPLMSFTAASIVPYAAVDSPGLSRRSGGCPAVWTQVKADLNNLFMAGDQCNDLARGAIRAVFHDCGSWDTSQGFSGGCDGSLVLGTTPDVELSRAENRGLQPIAGFLRGMAGKYSTSVADMIVFAGHAAVTLCPGGSRVPTFIGRNDSTTSAPAGGLPDVFDSAANIAALFAKKGLDAEDLAALLGAHSTSTQKFVDPTQFNKSQDSTPGQWDVTYFKETYSYATTGSKSKAVFVLPSDSKLSTYNDVGKEFQSFIGNQAKWTSSFVSAMERLALFGNDKSQMVDCTSALG